MSMLSFKIFCIEHYSKHIGLPSNEAYLLLKQEGILTLLEEDYGDLHGMSIEYLMQMFDQYLEESGNDTLSRSHSGN